VRRHTPRLRPGQDFYGSVITDARRAALHALLPGDPIGQHIALLRLTLRDAVSEGWGYDSRILHLMNAILRLVLLRHRLSSGEAALLPPRAGRALRAVQRLLPRRAA